MRDGAALDCRLIFSPTAPAELRHSIMAAIESSAFGSTGVMPEGVVWTFGSVLFQVRLPRQRIIEVILANVPAHAVRELLVDGQKAWPQQNGRAGGDA